MSENMDKKTCDTIGCRATATHVLTWRDREAGTEHTENVCEEDGMMYTYRPSLGATLAPMAAAEAPAPRSGYTPCACRDCMDTTVSSDTAQPELCPACAEAGCEPCTWIVLHPGEECRVGRLHECQRDDAYGEC